ncbi:MAG: hypothetical protein MJY98_01045 [Fibrobacter sp.]|nr:hypothetical protein [Fibrobacter sp.]
MSSSNLYKKFFALLRYSLGIDEVFEHRLSAEEWTVAYRAGGHVVVA